MQCLIGDTGIQMHSSFLSFFEKKNSDEQTLRPCLAAPDLRLGLVPVGDHGH
jgi:hypothetical protein